MSEPLVVSAPGKVILHGEHAVVYGTRAIAASLDVRTFCRVEPHNDGHVVICLKDINTEISWTIAQLEAGVSLPTCDVRSPCSPSPELMKQLFTLADVQEQTHDTKQLAIIAFLYLYTSLSYKDGKLQSFKGYLSSRLPTGAGLGSSAAFATCLSATLLTLQGAITRPDHSAATHIGCWTEKEDLELINAWAFEAEKIIHGKPSGIDNSVSTFGGALRFQSGEITALKKVPQLRILLTSTNVPRSTKAVVAQVRDTFNDYPTVIKPIIDAIEAISVLCEETLEKLCDAKTAAAHYVTLGDLIDQNQGLLNTLGVSHPSLQQIIDTTHKYGLHSKLTGAGAGGCAFTLVPFDTDKDTLDKLETDLTELGFDCWETSIGGHGVISHSSNLSNYRLPKGF